MRVLLVHNSYRQKGGEEVAVETLRAALVQAGHAADVFEVSSAEWDTMSAPRRILRAVQTPFSFSAGRALRERVAAFRPDVAHIHNLFPLISPAAVTVLRRARVPVVMTLHNFRLGCVNGLLFRDGSPCEKCIDGSLLNGVLNRCYRGGVAGSSVAAATLALHRGLGTWDGVARFIVGSRFSAGVFGRMGLPSDRLRVIPNAVEPVARALPVPDGRRFLYVGRLSQEKGIEVLIRAFDQLHDSDFSLDIVGEGPLSGVVGPWAAAYPGGRVSWHGFVDSARKERLLAGALATIFPSVCYENSPFALLESLSAGVPAVASRRGGIPELVREGETGWLFEAADAASLADTLQRAIDASDHTALRGRCFDLMRGRSAGGWLSAVTAVYEDARRLRSS